MTLGSHNSMSYLAPARWWMRPFRVFARCQKKSIREQIDCGVRCFDLRVSFDSSGRPRFSHGLVDFELPADFASGTSLPDPSQRPLHSVLELLEAYAMGGDTFYIRLILEKEQRPGDIGRFYRLCRYVEQDYPHLTFIGGVTKKGWELIYDFHDPVSETEIAQPIGSMAPDARWYERFIPILYVQRHKYRIPSQPSTTKIILCDFV